MLFNWYTFLSETGAEIAPAHLFKHVEKSIEPTFLIGHTLEVELSVCKSLDHNLLPSCTRCWPCEVLFSTDKTLFLRWCVPFETRFPLLKNNETGIKKGAYRNVELSKEDPLLSFWVPVNDQTWLKIHPMGWSEENNLPWHMPFSDLKSVTKYAQETSLSPGSMWHNTKWGRSLLRSCVPRSVFEARCFCLYGLIQVGGFLECEHQDNPMVVWPVKVLNNCGGRISVSWLASNPVDAISQRGDTCSFNGTKDPAESSTFTLHFLNPRFHQIGWGFSKGYLYRPPASFHFPDPVEVNEDFFRNLGHAFHFEKTEDSPVSNGYDANCYPFSPDPPKHTMREGLKLEALHFSRPYGAFPATITQVLSDRYFIVKFDNLQGSNAITRTAPNELPSKKAEGQYSPSAQEPVCFVAHLGMPHIMPPTVSQYHGLHLFPPNGWPSDKPFTWHNYLSFMTESSRFNDSDSCIHPRNSANDGETDFRTLNENFLINFLSAPISKCFGQRCQSPLLSERVSGLPDSASDSCLYARNSGSVKSSIMQDRIPAEDDPLFHELSYSRESLGQTPQTGHAPLKDFFVGMKLECALPSHVWEYLVRNGASMKFGGPPLCSATIIRVQAGLLWLIMDLPHCLFSIDGSFVKGLRLDSPILIECFSTEIYPLGWSSTFGHPFIPPSSYFDPHDLSLPQLNGFFHSKMSVWPILPKPEEVSTRRPGSAYQTSFNSTGTIDISGLYEGSEYCPAIYINSSCYIGPYLCKASLESLPQQFGPGPVVRVLQYLLTRIVNAAYKPLRVLRLLEADWANSLIHALPSPATSGAPLPPSLLSVLDNVKRYGNRCPASASLKHALAEVAEQRHEAMSLVLLRVRCPRRGIKVEAPVEVCCKQRAVEEFCRQVSLLLEACPNLISIRPFSASTPLLPENQPTTVPTHRKPANAIPCPVHCHCLIRTRRVDRWVTGSSRRRIQNFSAQYLESIKGGPLYNWNPERSTETVGAERTTAHTAANSGFHSADSYTTPSVRTRSVAAALGNHSANSTGAASVSSSSASFSTSHVTTSAAGSAIDQSAKPPFVRTGPNGSRGVYSPLNHVYHHYNHNERSVQAGRRRRIAGLPRVQAIKRYVANLRPVSARKEAAAAAAAARAGHANGASTAVAAVAAARAVLMQNAAVFSGASAAEDFCSGVAAAAAALVNSDLTLFGEVPRVVLQSNPIDWTAADVAAYLEQTDCRELWPWLATEAVDGRAFMLLSLPVLHTLKGLHLEAAVRLARQVASVKRAFLEQFCSTVPPTSLAPVATSSVSSTSISISSPSPTGSNPSPACQPPKVTN
ncbi:unnamed protein product [Schistocephalus solidus]|uniref:SLED domain-containing protein n=2 Tax=Schistocephalus solidus TaxID=70667 RepID=A0A0X3P4H7_SCHSO|nr:unnamed protein product [Schistocephalus solidus]